MNRARTLALVLAAALSGCNNDTSPSPQQSGDMAVGPDLAGALTVIKVGYITVFDYDYMQGPTHVQTYGANALFSILNTNGCIVGKIGVWDTFSCVPGQTPTNAEASAGEINITGGMVPIKMSPTPGATTSIYAGVPGTTGTLFGSTSVSLTATWAGSADILAGSLTIPTPEILTLTAPTFPTEPAMLVIDRTKPFVLSFNKAAHAKLLVQILGTDTSNQQVTYNASFDASTGTATIGTDITGTLQPGSASLFISVASTATVTVNDFKVTFGAGGTLLDSNQQKVIGLTVTVQ